MCERELARSAAAAGRATGATASGALDLAGRHVVVTAGGTREPLDPVRYLGNRSSGKQGYALAEAAARARRRASPSSPPRPCPRPAGVDVVPVETALELETAVTDAVRGADAVVMAAAVADFRPAAYAEHKIKKTHGPAPDGGADDSVPVVPLVRNPDVLAGLVRDPGERDHRRSSSASPPRPVTTPARCSTTAGPSSSARAATCSSSTRWASA